MKLKTYYLEQYPDDDLGAKIKENTTFEGLFDALERYQDVYEYIGVHDSLIRERLFEKLADIIDMPYDYVYYQWLSPNR
jgi:hypothetical protein